MNILGALNPASWLKPKPTLAHPVFDDAPNPITNPERGAGGDTEVNESNIPPAQYATTPKIDLSESDWKYPFRSSSPQSEFDAWRSKATSYSATSEDGAVTPLEKAEFMLAKYRELGTFSEPFSQLPANVRPTALAQLQELIEEQDAPGQATDWPSILKKLNDRINNLQSNPPTLGVVPESERADAFGRMFPKLPERIELSNEELLKAGVQAMILGRSGGSKAQIAAMTIQRLRAEKEQERNDLIAQQQVDSARAAAELQSREKEVQQSNLFNLKMWEQSLEMADGDKKVALEIMSKEQGKYLDAARTLLTDMDRYRSDQIPAAYEQLRRLYQAAGAPELAPTEAQQESAIARAQEREAQVAAAKHEQNARMLIPGLLTAVRDDNAEIALPAAEQLLDYAKRYPELIPAYGTAAAQQAMARGLAQQQVKWESEQTERDINNQILRIKSEHAQRYWALTIQNLRKNLVWKDAQIYSALITAEYLPLEKQIKVADAYNKLTGEDVSPATRSSTWQALLRSQNESIKAAEKRLAEDDKQKYKKFKMSPEDRKKIEDDITKMKEEKARIEKQLEDIGKPPDNATLGMKFDPTKGLTGPIGKGFEVLPKVGK